MHRGSLCLEAHTGMSTTEDVTALVLAPGGCSATVPAHSPPTPPPPPHPPVAHAGGCLPDSDVLHWYTATCVLDLLCIHSDPLVLQQFICHLQHICVVCAGGCLPVKDPDL